MKIVLSALPILMAALVPASALTVSCDNPKLFFAPYTWRQSGNGDAARAEATLAGAYIKAAFSGSASVGLVVDGTANAQCPQSARPILDWSIDKGPVQTQQINRADLFTLPLAQGLDKGKQHEVQVWLRATGLSENRWGASTDHLRVAALALDDGATLAAVPLRPKRMIGFGDSITEGVGVEARLESWGNIMPNDAEKTWVPLLAGALDCEYGQLGCSGLGMAMPREIPPFPGTWSLYDAGHSRLQNGLLVPEPDYIFNNLGTNDQVPNFNITAPYTQWLTDARKAAPHARIFVIVPLMGVHRAEIMAAVKARQNAGDARLALIDLPELQPWFDASHGATAYSYEGCHPSAEGQSLFAVHLGMKVQKILDAAP